MVHFDESKNATMLLNAEIAAGEINRVFERVDSFLEIKPNSEKRQRLLNEGYDYVLAELREKFPFPKATDEFNFTALGIEPTPLKEPLKGLGMKMSQNFLHLKGIKVAVTEKSKEQIKNDCSYWTRNEEENLKYDFANKLCVFLNQNSEELQKYCKIMPSNDVSVRGSKSIFNRFVLAQKREGEQTYVPWPPVS